MEIKALLPRSHVLLHLAGSDREAILRALMQPLLADGMVTAPDTLMADLLRRDDEITTQLEAGVAFPHARTHAVRRLGLTVGIADPPGLVFSPEYGRCCRLFFFITVPSFAPTAHLPLLQLLADMAHDSKRRQRLLASRTPAQAVRLVSTYKGTS